MRDGIRPQVCVPGNIYRVSCPNQIIIGLPDVFVQFFKRAGEMRWRMRAWS